MLQMYFAGGSTYGIAGRFGLSPSTVARVLKEAGISRLAYYADPTARVFQELKAVGRAVGMPTTLLVDASGCEIASLAGPAEWASDDAIKLFIAALGR